MTDLKQPPSVSVALDDDKYDKDLQDVLDDGPSLNEVTLSVHPGTQNSVPGSVMERAATSNVSLHDSNNSGSSRTVRSSNGDFSPKSIGLSAQKKMETIKDWSVSTFKTTRQFLLERFGKGSKTVDLDMEASIASLRDTQQQYLNILRLAHAMASHFFNVIQTQRALGESFSDMAQKSPELQEEFIYNCETQRTLVKNGEILLAAVNFFISCLNTLCNKTIEDTMNTVKSYESARLEYDAYRTDYETLAATTPLDSTMQAKLLESRRKFEEHKAKFERLREDVRIKVKLLDDNRVKVMHKQLLLFHNAVSAYFSGNATALDATLKQFSIQPKQPNSGKPSWLES